MDSRTVALLKTVNDGAFERIGIHPFVELAARTMLTRNEVVRWLFCAGRDSLAFLDLLMNLVAQLERSHESPQILAILQEKLNNEQGGDNPDQIHWRHYLQVLNRIGLDENDFYSYKNGTGVRFAVNLARNIPNWHNLAQAIGYMLANEGLTPLIYGAMATAIQHHFPSLETEFFRPRAEVNERHLAAFYEAAVHLPEGRSSDVRTGILLGERGKGTLLDEASGLLDYPVSPFDPALAA
jgi:pyrroloquinoline quinone (PQQ) biosynthesis protein C